MQQHADVVIDLKGNVIKGASVRVLLLDGTLATIYAANGGAPTINPIPTGQKGEFAFFAPNGDYLLEISAGGKVQGTQGPVKLYDVLDDGDAARWSSLAADDGSSRVGHGTGSVAAAINDLMLTLSGMVSARKYGVLPIEAGATSPADTATKLEVLRLDASLKKLTVLFEAGTYVLPAGTRLDANNSTWIFAPGAVFKLTDEQATATDFLIFAAPANQRISGLRVDANRATQNAATFGADRCAVLVYNPDGCLFDSMEVISSPGKGFGLVSTPANTSRDVAIRNFKGGNCQTQVLIIDGNNMTGLFERVVIDGVRIGATSHGGLVINDGAHNIAASNVIADVQNSTWDAVAIRDSWDLQLSNVRGSRGRNGVYLQRLNGLCGRIQMDNVVGERSAQNGVLMAGVENVTGGAVTGRNNVGAGINITTGPSSYRSKNVSIAAPAGYDDQATPTQQYGVLVQGVDGCTIGKPIAYGNTTRNTSINRSATSEVRVPTQQTASGTTGSIAANSQAVVTLSWPQAFEDANIEIDSVYVSEGTSSLALCVGHIVAITTAAVQVMVRNLSGTTAHTGTLTIKASRQV